MATQSSLYPTKLGRFIPNKCVDLLYSAPVGTGVFNEISMSFSQPLDRDYMRFDLELYENNDGFFLEGNILSSGILTAKIISLSGTTVTVEVSKDSFVTIDDRTAWLSKHSGIHYNYEILRFYNDDSGDIKNAILPNLKTHKLKRINKSAKYSEFGFVYNEDYEYEITLKNIVVNDLIELDSIMSARSYVLIAQDESVVFPNTAISNNPNIINNLSIQPYYGGLQNNIYYRAIMKSEEFEWTGSRYKGNMTFIIKG